MIVLYIIATLLLTPYILGLIVRIYYCCEDLCEYLHKNKLTD